MSLKMVADAVERLARRVGGIDAAAQQRYVQSRGNGLITNGSGLLRNNTNFSRMVFDGGDVYAGFGCFTTSVLNNDASTDELIPVNLNSTYEFSFAARTMVKNGESRCYAYLLCADIDGKTILPHNLPFTFFRIAQPLSANGQIVVHADDRAKVESNIRSKLTSAASMFLLSADYTSAGGYKHPTGSYSQTFYGSGSQNATTPVTYDQSTGIITGVPTNLITGTFPAGTMLAIGQSGGTYVYLVPEMTNGIVPDVWTPYSRTFVAKDVIRPYTSMVKFGWLCNRNSQAGNKQAFSAIDFRQK